MRNILVKAEWKANGLTLYGLWITTENEWGAYIETWRRYFFRNRSAAIYYSAVQYMSHNQETFEACFATEIISEAEAERFKMLLGQSTWGFVPVTPESKEAA